MNKHGLCWFDCSTRVETEERNRDAGIILLLERRDWDVRDAGFIERVDCNARFHHAVERPVCRFHLAVERGETGMPVS